jgi:hypothetical protein
MLREIRAIFDRHSTDYRIVVSPLYHQVPMNAQDIRMLEEVFSETNVYDFSGVNEFTCDVRNYYETSHYRPTAAREIMCRIYGTERATGNEPVASSHRS